MAFIGPGAIWDMETGTFIATNVPGVQADYDAAKAAISAGVFYVGPGLEGLVLGTFGPNQVLMLITATGIVGYSRFHILDGVDPTRRLHINVSGVSAGVTRVATSPNYDGNIVLATGFGASGEFLKSNGGGVAPSWAAVTAAGHDLLDGVVHPDTVAQAVLRGALVIGNATPKWDRLPIGAASRLLKSDGVDPSWGTVDLLSAFHGDTVPQAVTRGALVIGDVTPKWNRLPIGANGNSLVSDGNDPFWTAVQLLSAYHTDTLAASPVRGDLIVANATPAWARFAKGAANTFLGSDGTDLQWRTAAAVAAAIQASIEHNALLHLKPISAANCTWNNGSLDISTTGSAFANVKVGDIVVTGGNATPGNIGRRVTVWTDADNITVDEANTGTTLSGVTLVFIPGDHWDDTIAQDSNGAGVGVLLSRGRGKYSATGPGTTFQEWRGPVRWMGDANGSVATDLQVQGSTSLPSPFGFRIFKTVAILATFYVNDLSASRSYRLPDIGDATFVMNAGAQDVASKRLTVGTGIMMDGTATYATFEDAAQADKLSFDLSGMTTLRAVAYRDYGGNAVVASNVGAAGEVLTSNGAATAPSYQAAGAGSPPPFVSLAKWGTD